MTERVLRARELNRALLARQLLLERARLSVEPYERLMRSVRKEVDEEAERLAAFHA